MQRIFSAATLLQLKSDAKVLLKNGRGVANLQQSFKAPLFLYNGRT
jgi:hypothetical protein